MFFITIPASGFFVRDSSATGRVVITATAADAETNESQFHGHLAQVLHDPPHAADGDRDRDGRLSLLDVYLGIVRRVMTEYRDGKLIPTEHALLDDNGDGRGTELQLGRSGGGTGWASSPTPLVRRATLAARRRPVRFDPDRRLDAWRGRWSTGPARIRL